MISPHYNTHVHSFFAHAIVSSEYPTLSSPWQMLYIFQDLRPMPHFLVQPPPVPQGEVAPPSWAAKVLSIYIY